MVPLTKPRIPLVMVLFLLAHWLLLTGLPTRAETFLVCAQGCPYSSIQGAVDRASPGDTILVQAGTYTENLVLPALEMAGSARVSLVGTEMAPIRLTSARGTALRARDQAQLTAAHAQFAGET
ncbi:MAG: hypothetical protein N2443_12165, partial [Blastocatellia bacterium]|nr:hypothetical protein [Blastocatellia bacterium]